MNANETTMMDATSHAAAAQRGAGRTEAVLFVMGLVALNWPLLRGAFAEQAIFLPSRVVAGEWWRLFTHPFVHVSWYHLLLDAGAFLLLYRGLEEQSVARRLCYVVACAIGSLGACLIGSDAIYTQGLCGLSGIDHGLMAICALEMMSHGNDAALRRAGRYRLRLSWGRACGTPPWTRNDLVPLLWDAGCADRIVACGRCPGRHRDVLPGRAGSELSTGDKSPTHEGGVFQPCIKRLSNVHFMSTSTHKVILEEARRICACHCKQVTCMKPVLPGTTLVIRNIGSSHQPMSKTMNPSNSNLQITDANILHTDSEKANPLKQTLFVVGSLLFIIMIEWMMLGLR